MLFASQHSKLADNHDASKSCMVLQTFPTDYATAVRQAQSATVAALQDGHKLIEVEFPTSSLQGVSGRPQKAPIRYGDYMSHVTKSDGKVNLKSL